MDVGAIWERADCFPKAIMIVMEHRQPFRQPKHGYLLLD